MRARTYGSPQVIKSLLSTYGMQYAIQQGALRSPTNSSPKITIISRTHWSIPQSGLIIWFAFKELEGKKTQHLILHYIKKL